MEKLRHVKLKVMHPKLKKIWNPAPDHPRRPRGQIVGARESLSGQKNMARRKVKNGEKSPSGQCPTRPVPNGHCHSGFWLVPENFCVFLPKKKAERRRPFWTGLVRHCPQGLFSSFFTFLCAIFFPAHLDFPLPPLSASGSPRMAPD